MTAPTTTRVTFFKGDAPTAAQTVFNARDSLAGRLDDTTVAQAAREPAFGDRTPTPGMADPTEEGRK
jgi:hypothetical protein